MNWKSSKDSIRAANTNEIQVLLKSKWSRKNQQILLKSQKN